MYLEFKYPSVTCNYIQQTLVNVSKYIFSYGVTLDFITILIQCLMYTNVQPFFYPKYLKHYFYTQQTLHYECENISSQYVTCNIDTPHVTSYM